MFRWLCDNILDAQREEIAQALREVLEHSTSCPRRYNPTDPTCVCHVERAARFVEEWDR
jgi:hypothetical protein